jgi:hypothetical protein
MDDPPQGNREDQSEHFLLPPFVLSRGTVQICPADEARFDYTHLSARSAQRDDFIQPQRPAAQKSLRPI